MKKMSAAAAAFAILFATGCMAEGEPMALAASEPAELGAVLEGRVAMRPVSCVRRDRLRGTRSAGPGVLVFDDGGGTIYVNRTIGDCRLRHPLTLSVASTSSSLCAGDVAQVFDPYTGIQGGFCTLGTFEPYRRAD